MATEDLFFLRIANTAGKELQALPAKQYKQVASKIFSLSKNPKPTDSKKLQGIEGYRVDQGEYRVLYTINEDSKTVDVYRVGKRNGDEVYRNL